MVGVLKHGCKIKCHVSVKWRLVTSSKFLLLLVHICEASTPCTKTSKTLWWEEVEHQGPKGSGRWLVQGEGDGDLGGKRTQTKNPCGPWQGIFISF